MLAWLTNAWWRWMIREGGSPSLPCHRCGKGVRYMDAKYERSEDGQPSSSALYFDPAHPGCAYDAQGERLLAMHDHCYVPCDASGWRDPLHPNYRNHVR